MPGGSLEIKGKTPTKFFRDIPFNLSFLKANYYTVTLKEGCYAYSQYQINFYSSEIMENLELYKVTSFMNL